MTPALQNAATFAAEQFRRLIAVIKRHPVRAALLLPTLMLLYVLALIPFTPSIGDLRKAKAEAPSVLLASDGTVLAEYKRINRLWVSLDKIAPNVVNALIATEDRRFYEHHGIDFRRTAGAVISSLTGRLQGGSTITQQLARNLYPEEIGRAATINRKVKEAITALKIEAVYSKREILETYLNTVPFLYNAFGIEMAARTYFDKSADKLDVLESATLIGMLKGTSYYNPVLNPERSLQRRNLVLAQMAKSGKLDPARVELLAKRPLRLDFERQVEPLGPAPHVAQHLRKWLIAWADRRGYDIHADGLRVRTTLDAKIQKAANQAVARQLAQLQTLADGRRKAGQEPAVLQAGFLALDPRSGAVRAWVGSRDYATEQFDHVSQARRQPGSTFKPFVYGAAFIQGFSHVRFHRPAGGDHITRRRGLVAQRCDTADVSAHLLKRRTGVFQKHHHRPTDGKSRSGPRRAAGAGAGRAAEQARPGALARAGHQPGHAGRDGRRLRQHSQRRQLYAAGAGAAGGRPQRQTP